MFQNPHRYTSWGNSRGQIVVEYVLILVVVVVLALLITNTMVSRSPDSPGFVIQKWDALIKTVGQDKADAAE